MSAVLPPGVFQGESDFINYTLPENVVVPSPDRPCGGLQRKARESALTSKRSGTDFGGALPMTPILHDPPDITSLRMFLLFSVVHHVTSIDTRDGIVVV